MLGHNCGEQYSHYTQDLDRKIYIATERNVAYSAINKIKNHS